MSTAREYAPVMPLIPSMKLYALMMPTQTISAGMTAHQSSTLMNPRSTNISSIDANCTRSRHTFGTECTSSAKLTAHIAVSPAMNHG